MGNYHGTDKDKKSGSTHKSSLKVQRKNNDANFAPPTLMSSKKVKKKKLERCKRVNYFECPSEVSPNEPRNNTSTLTNKKLPTNVESHCRIGPNGSTTKQIQKKTLLQYAQSPSDDYHCVKSEICSGKKEQVTRKIFRDIDNLKGCKNNVDNSIRVFPRYMREQRKFEINDQKVENKIQKKNILFHERNVEKNDVSENNKSSVDNNPDERLVTLDKDETISELLRLKNENSKRDKVTGKVRPISLPIADDHNIKLRHSMPKKLEQVDIIGIKSLGGKRINSSDCHVADEQKYLYDKSDKSDRRRSKDGLICISKNQKSSTIGKALQKLKVSSLDSRLYLPDFFEMGNNKKRELYKTDKMVDLLLKPGTLLNLIGCHGSGKSEILSLLGLQLVKHKQIACLTIDCYGRHDERSILQGLLKIFKINFSPLPDVWIDDDYNNQFDELINYLANYICFHGQIQQIVLMFDDLNVDSCHERNCVDAICIPLLKRCMSCLSILLCSDVNLLDVPEEKLILNEHISNGLSRLGSIEKDERLINKKEIMEEGKQIQMHAFRLSHFYKFISDIVENFVADQCPLADDDNLQICKDLASKHNLTLNSWKILIRTTCLMPKSTDNIMEKVQFCTHPSLIVLENDLVTRRAVQNKQSMRNQDWDPFNIEKMNASVVLATLETLDDDEQTMSTILWLMSDFKSGFDLESVSFATIVSKYLDDDLNGRVKISEIIESDSFDDSKEHQSRIINALAKLVKIGLLQIVKSPVTFSSPLSSDLNDQIAKPCRLLLDQKQSCFTLGQSDISPEILPPKYRIPNSVAPIVRHLRPEYHGRPTLILDYLMAKKLKSLYRMFYSSDSFSNTFDELESIQPDLIVCLERNFETEHDIDELRSSIDFKVDHPLMHACYCLVSLPGSFFLAQILPLSIYMKIFSGISRIIKQKHVIRDLTNVKDQSSFEYRALLCIILRHKMASTSKDSLVQPDFKADVISPSQILKTEPNQSDASESNCKKSECPTNLYNFKESISGMSNLKEASVADMISRIKFLLFQVNKNDKAFFYYIMGIHLWQTDNNQAAVLMKKSLDFFKESGTDSGDEILHNFGQICIQIVSETYCWMLISTDKIQAARHIYNLSDSNPSSSSSSPPPIISQSSFQPTSSSSSSSYYSLHSHHGLSPSSGRNDGEAASETSATSPVSSSTCHSDKHGSYDRGPAGDCGSPMMIMIGGKEKKYGQVDADKILSPDTSVDSSAVLARCRNTLKSMGDFNNHHQQQQQRNMASKSLSTARLDLHPLKLRGLECRRKIWCDLGLLARSRDAAKSCVEVSAQWWGPDHPSTSEARMGLCLLSERLGRNHEAVDACVQALTSRLKFYGDKHTSTVDSCTVLSRLLLKCSMYNECLELARRSLNMGSHLKPRYKETQTEEIERIIGVAERKLKLEKQKRDSTTIQKSVTFHPDNISIEETTKRVTSSESDGKNKVKDIGTCSSIICKFDPEIAQTFHRCIRVPTIA